MANTSGRRQRQREALDRETKLGHIELAEKIDAKIKRRGEWKFKTKRSSSAAAARSKSKKGK